MTDVSSDLMFVDFSDFFVFFHFWKETKLKAALNRDIVDIKKGIYTSIQITIVKEMASCYQRKLALRVTINHKLC